MESTRITDERLNQLVELERYVRSVVTQTADDLCWRDVYQELAGRVGVELDLRLLPTEQFLANCKRFEESLRTGCPYAQDKTTAELKDYAEAREMLGKDGFYGSLVDMIKQVLARSSVWKSKASHQP